MNQTTTTVRRTDANPENHIGDDEYSQLSCWQMLVMNVEAILFSMKYHNSAPRYGERAKQKQQVRSVTGPSLNNSN